MSRAPKLIPASTLFPLDFALALALALVVAAAAAVVLEPDPVVDVAAIVVDPLPLVPLLIFEAAELEALAAADEAELMADDTAEELAATAVPELVEPEATVDAAPGAQVAELGRSLMP